MFNYRDFLTFWMFLQCYFILDSFVFRISADCIDYHQECPVCLHSVCFWAAGIPADPLALKHWEFGAAGGIVMGPSLG